MNIGNRVVWQAKQEAVLDGQLQAGQLLAAQAGHHDWRFVAYEMNHKVGSVYDGEIVHRSRVQSPFRPGLATDSALEGTDHTPRIQITSASFLRQCNHQNMEGFCGCLLVTRITVSVAGVDSTTTWWMYKRVWERPRL